MPSSVELRQQRARVVESMRAITENSEKENRGLNAEERQTYDRHETDFTEFTERINRVEAEEKRDAELAQSVAGGQGGQTGGGGVDGSDKEARAKERRTAFLAYVRRGAGMISPEQRALVENSDGQILVPEDLEAEIYRSLPKLTIMRPLAAKRTTVRDRVRRRSLDEVTVGWGKLETNDQTLQDSMPDTPTEDYSYVEDQYGLAKIGEDEFDDTDVNLEAFVTDSFTRALGESEDTAFTVGLGHASHQPVGWSTAGGGISAVTSTATTYAGTTTNAPGLLIDDMISLIYAVPAQYRKNGSFVMASSSELRIAQTKDANGQYLWQASVQSGRPNTFLGYALYDQEDVAAIAAAKAIAGFGDWNSGYRILDRQGMTVQRLVELYSEDGEIGFKVRRRVGGDVVRPDALRLLKTHA